VAFGCGVMDKNDGIGNALELITCQRVELGLREFRDVSMESFKSKSYPANYGTRVDMLTDPCIRSPLALYLAL
jgi:hypothetical protein